MSLTILKDFVTEEEREQLIGVKVIDAQQAPDPNTTSTGKWLKLNLIWTVAYIQSNEEKKLAEE